MRLRSIVPAIVTSALVAAGALAVVQEASYAAAPAAPHGQVDSFFERQGNGKVCHPIALEDEDSPLEKLIVTITSNPAPNAITLEKNNGYQLCVDTSQPTNLGAVRLRVTDPENMLTYLKPLSWCSPHLGQTWRPLAPSPQFQFQSVRTLVSSVSLLRWKIKTIRLKSSQWHSLTL